MEKRVNYQEIQWLKNRPMAPILENSSIGGRIASQLQELSKGKGGNVRRKFEIFLGKITGFHQNTVFFI